MKQRAAAETNRAGSQKGTDSFPETCTAQRIRRFYLCHSDWNLAKPWISEVEGTSRAQATQASGSMSNSARSLASRQWVPRQSFLAFPLQCFNMFHKLLNTLHLPGFGSVLLDCMPSETLRFPHPLPAVLLCWQARTPETEGSAPLAATWWIFDDTLSYPFIINSWSLPKDYW